MTGALVQARALLLQGKRDRAIELVQQFLRREPHHAEANHSMAVLLMQTGQTPRAAYFAERAVAASPATADYRITLAAALDAQGQRAKALTHAAEAQRTGSAEILSALLPLYWGMGELDRALATAEQAMRIAPDAVRAPYGNLLLFMGETERAVALLRSELVRTPGARDVLTALVQALNYQHGTDPREVFELHQRLGATFPSRPEPERDADPDRRLKIGLISPDLYTQSVAYFTEPILEHLDRARFEIYCYSSATKSDATTARLKAKADQWRDLADVTEDAALALLDADRLDVLIDLAGHTAGSGLNLVAMRPAPVLVSAIGYPNTTGLPQIGYRLVDAITDPPSSLATEQLVRLPGCFLCYRPPDHAPAVDHNRPHRPLTFGSFNVVSKIQPPVIEAWSRIVIGVPGARLYLKSGQFGTPSIRERFVARFRDAGLDSSRLELAPAVASKSDHLSLYNRVDIALDPFPYNGTTTTCEALFMGVPVVSLVGSVHAARVGASLLTAAGTPELITHTPDQYHAHAVALASNPDRLTLYKRTLREKLLASPLCDGAAYGRALGDALRSMWRSWCAART